MSLGPVLVFDKSTLQSLSVDESVWLDNFFLTNITPLFYVETLADLEKKTRNGRTPQQVVGRIAFKTPAQGSYPNTHHQRLIMGDLLGSRVEMNNRPILAGGETKISPDGKVGIYFEETPEAKAFRRWQKQEFLEVEREFAKQWRNDLSNINFDPTVSLIKNIIPKDKRFKSLSEIKIFVDQFIRKQFREIYQPAFKVLGVPTKLRHRIISRWLEEKCPPFYKFAPYASYVFEVDLVFFLGLASNLISKNNKIDMSYLYYLPFCMVFASNDKFHAKTAPLFTEKGQIFVNGQDLKISLGEIDEYYSKFSDEIETQGIIKFAAYPPEEIDTLITRLWDKFLPSWRQHAREGGTIKRSKKLDKKLIEKFNRQEKGATPLRSVGPISPNQVDSVSFKRKISVRKGNWRILPPEVEKAIKNRK